MSNNRKKVLDVYLSAMIKAFVEQANALSTIKHKPTKGQLREIFTQNFLKHFLPEYLNIGSGVIINNQGDQSKETDIIIYDNRLLPAFLFGSDLNIFPIESVVAIVEVKSFLNQQSLVKAEKDAKYLMNKIRKNNNWLIGQPPHPPIPCLLGLRGHRIKKISTKDDTWIKNNIEYLRLICFVNKYSWVRLFDQQTNKPYWSFGSADSDFNEIRRFIAILVDNLRRTSTQNWLWSSKKHNDWLGQYIRIWDIE